MRNLVLIFTLFTTCLFAQTGINYQGAASDADGAKLVNQNISLKTSVLQGGVDGTTSYSEIHNTTTDQFGLFNIVIGQGVSISGDFETISWGSGDHFLKVELDATGGTNYNLVSTTQMMSVPYALYAKNAGLDSAAVADMLASMNISSNHSGGCNPHYPEGLNGEGVTWNFDDGDYLVPSGKNLYITNAAFVGSMKIDDITVRYGITNDVFADVYENNLSAPIIAGQNQIVSFIGSTSNSIFNGILVDATSLQAVTIDLQTEAYTVPNNKRLFVISPFLSHEPDNLFIDDLVINTGGLNVNQLMGLNNPLVLNSGQEIRSELEFGTEGSINGYLVDEDYFADCGGSGGSSSSTPSSLDSAMVADMIAANTSSGSGSDWELLYDELNTNNDEPYGTVNRYGIAQSDGFLYLVGSYATVYTGNDHDTITNTWPENPILQNISANDPNEAHIIPLKKNMSWHIEFHSTLGYITKGYFIPNGGGSASFTNGGISGTSKSFKYPDGMNGTPITWHLPGNDYTVPEGKNLYITAFSGHNNGDRLRIDGLEIMYSNHFISEICVVGAGSVLSTNSNTSADWANFNGILVDAKVSPITWSLPGNDYTVPEGKKLYITAYSGYSNGQYMKINGLEMIYSNTFSDVIIVDAGSVISTNSNTSADWANFNGYLADEDYFESPSSSSASNSGGGANTMDLSVSQYGDTLYGLGNDFLIIPGISAANQHLQFSEYEFGSVTDIDGNTYKTLVYGENEWMVENLRTNTGDFITGTSAGFEYNDSIGNYYSYSTVQSEICPDGWHVSTIEDWLNLHYVIFASEMNPNGYTDIQNGYNENNYSALWSTFHIGGTNQSKFNLFETGWYDDGLTDAGQYSCHFITSTMCEGESCPEGPGLRRVNIIVSNNYNDFELDVGGVSNSSYSQIRCVKD